jgi:hypothetical protein
MEELIEILITQERYIKIEINDKYNFEINWFQNHISDDMHENVSLRTAKDTEYSYTHMSNRQIKRKLRKYNLVEEFTFKLEEEVLKGL